MLKKNRGLQLVAGLALSSVVFTGAQGIAFADKSPGIHFTSFIGITAIGGMQSATINAAEMNNDAITNHLSGTSMVKNSNNQKIWTEYIHNNSRVDKNTVSFSIPRWSPGETFSSLASYSNEVNGLVVGFDAIAEKNKYMGFVFNYGNGYVDSKGEMDTTRNDYDYWGMSVYENWKSEKVNIIADLGYMKNSGEIKQTNVEFGDLKDDIDSNILTAGVRGEFTTNVNDLTPYVGLRYVRLATDKFSSEVDEGTFNNEKDTQNLFLLPVGLKWSHKDTTERGYWKQTVSAGMVYAFGDTDAETNVYVEDKEEMVIIPLNFNIKDSRTFVGSLGLEGRNDDLTYGVRYQFQESTHEINNGIVVNMQYAF